MIPEEDAVLLTVHRQCFKTGKTEHNVTSYTTSPLTGSNDVLICLSVRTLVG